MCTHYGDSEIIGSREYAAFPAVDQLESVTESELRDLDFGIRAERIVKTVEAIQARSPPLTPLPSDLDEARAHLQEYYGVGSKVANCVLLYSGSYDSPVPVDTWIEQAVEKYYPEFAELKGDEAGRRLEDLYGEYAGHAQLYLFHYMRDAEN
jgi:N-glycosylase/DNA lyase